MSGTMLAHAIKYADKGYPVFPCRGKAPLTEHGLHDATTDLGALRARWHVHPAASVAIRTGIESRLVVLDVDGDDGIEALRQLERAHGPLPRTASVKTPRGGAHFYFAHPGGTVPCSSGRLGTGLDVRGDGGYVIAPPSIGANGVRYEPDEQAPATPLPTWLLALMRPVAGSPHPRTPAPTWVAMVRQGLPLGQRNAGLARIVGHLLARDVDARLVAELAHLVNTRSGPPLDDDEVDRVVRSIAGREVRRRTGVR